MKDINREFVLEIFIRNEDSPKYYNKRCLNSKFLKKKIVIHTAKHKF
jgi:hypothetical protein